MRRIRLTGPIATGLFVAVLLTAASASADVSARGSVTGPVLVGPDLVWGQASGHRLQVLQQPDGRGRPSLLVDVADPRGELSGSLAGSPFGYGLAYHVAVPGFDRDLGGEVLDEVVAGAPRQAPQAISRCDRQDPAGRIPPSLDVHQTVVAYIIKPCSGSATVEVRSLPGTPGTSRTLPAGLPDRVQVAGRFVAWSERDPSQAAAVVYDWQSGQLAYRIPGRVDLLDLAEDGTAVIRARGRVALADPRRTTPRLLPIAARGLYVARIAGDQLVFKRGTPERAGELATYDLRRGRTRRIDGDLVLRLDGGTFDYQGGPIAWEAPSCGGSVLRYRSRLPRRPQAVARRHRCALLLVGRPQLRARRRVGVAFRCSGFAVEYCPGTIHLSAKNGAGGYVTIGRKRVRETPAGVGRVSIVLNRRGRKQVAGRGRHAIRISATTRDARGRREIRHRRVTL